MRTRVMGKAKAKSKTDKDAIIDAQSTEIAQLKAEIERLNRLLGNFVGLAHDACSIDASARVPESEAANDAAEPPQSKTLPESEKTEPQNLSVFVEQVSPAFDPKPVSLRQLNSAIAPPFNVNPNNFVSRGYHLTDEQQQCLDVSSKGRDLKIEAGAGSGKTSTLAAISYHFAKRRGLYVAFNKAIVSDAEKVFHNNTKARTGHSLAFREVGHRFSQSGRLQSRLTSEMVVRALDLRDYCAMSPWMVANLLMSWVSRFCMSADPVISTRNVPWDLMKLMTKEGDKQRAFEVGKAMAQELLPLANKLWALMSDEQGALPITHDLYLKLWALGKPRLYEDLILFDEAQDASPVMMKVIQDQSAQKIWVGDRRQQIYAWRGAVNAMDAIRTDHTCLLTRSFRYGQPVAEMANVVLRNFLNEHHFSMVGSPTVTSRIEANERPAAFICRTNRSAVNELMNSLAKGKRVHMAGGVNDLISDIESAEALMEGRRPRSPSYQVFKTWAELVEYSESEVGAELAPLVKLLNQWPVHLLLNALRRSQSVSEDNADITISTAHTVKGREFNTIKLADDFVFPSTSTDKCKMKFSAEEGNLLYVALTRAKEGLDISQCTAARVAMGGGF